jgi:hypothetical protein
MRPLNFLVISTLLILLNLFQLPGTFASTTEKSEYIPVAEAIKKGFVAVEILSKGGNQGDCMTMNITNLIKDSLFLMIEPGRRLASIDTTQQDILIIHDENFLLTSGEKNRLSIYGFCCQSDLVSPWDSSIFSMGPMADSNLVAIACFLNEHDYPLDIAQEAVWAISDDHPISSVYAEDVEGIEELKNFLADLKGEEVPWYSAEYEESDEVLFTNRVESITGEVEIWIPSYCIVDIQVEDQVGRVMEQFEKMEAYHPGRYFYEFKFPVFDWPKGNYYLVIRTDGNVLYRKKFVL